MSVVAPPQPEDLSPIAALAALRASFETPLGRRLAALERTQLRHWLAEGGEADLLYPAPPWPGVPFDGCPIPLQWRLEPACPAPAGLCARLELLPFAEHALGVMLLVHALEWVEDPHAVLREAHFALRPEGRLLILGIQPLGLPGLTARLRRRRYAWCRRQIGPGRLREWLQLLGFQVTRSQGFCYRPWLERVAIFDRLAGMEGLGAAGWPLPAGLYLIEARKRVRTLTPLRPRWSRRPLAAPALGGLVNSGLGASRREGRARGDDL